MKHGRLFLWLWLLAGGLLSSVMAQQNLPTISRAADVRLDFARVRPGESLTARVDRPQYAITVEGRFNPATQDLLLNGTYEVPVPLAAGAKLSYQLYGDDGELLQWDGARLEWDAARRKAVFALELPLMAKEPRRQSLRVQFNAVVDGEYWYHERFPEAVFGAIELVEVPRRDEYRPRWTWVPSILPAEMRCLIPAAWSIGYRDDEHSGYVASLDVVDAGHVERLDSRRVPFPEEGAGGKVALTWLPLSPLVPGQVEIRPGLVWDDVRWYDAEGWFAYQPVRVVPPLLYVGGAMGLAVLLGAAWWGVGRLPSGAGRIVGRVVLLGGWVWLGGQLVISGTWLVVAMLLAMMVTRRCTWQREGMHSYVVVWLTLAFIEVYWGRMSGIAPVRGSATVFSLGVWAVVLLPLMFMRRKWLRRSLGLAVMVGWLLISTASVIYFQFFQDFPSVENLLYAGQVGELGDSLTSLVEQRHLIPLLMLGAALATWWWPRSEQANPISETRSGRR